MDSTTALIIVNIMNLMVEKGIPAFIEWNDGTALDDPTIEDFEKLKVKTMAGKIGGD